MSTSESATRRADVALVARGLFPSRAKAQEAIAAGLVTADGRLVAKPSEQIAADANVAAEAPYPWVSRGGVKLAAALDAFGFDPAGLTCLDIGASTGGFTEVLLARGAASVTAVDVGRGQLHARLVADARVRRLEATDARSLTAALLGPPPDLVVCDVSFISLRLILPTLLPLAAAGGALVALAKPQYEVGPALVRKGIVRDADVRDAACVAVEACVASVGWRLLGRMPSPIQGGDGNHEYLVAARAP